MRSGTTDLGSSYQSEMKLHETDFRYALPAAVGIVSLIALAVLPLVMNSRTNAIREQVESAARPARWRLNEINYLLSVQISSLRIASVSGDDDYLDDYRSAAEARKRVMALLGRDVGRMGREVQERFAELENHVARWEDAVETARREGLPGQGIAAIARETTYASVINDLRLLDNGMSSFEMQLNAELRRLVGIETMISAALVGVAFLAAASVLVLQGRLRRLTSGLRGALEREREARQTAEALVRARDEILGIVSHDLRGPLTTISLSAQLLPRDELVETILLTTRQMQRLIQDLLDAVKVESTGLAIRDDVVDPAAVVNDVFTTHEVIATEKKIRLEKEVARDLPSLRGDHDRLVQALTNLVGNAIKFTPEEGAVRLQVHVVDDRVRFVVEDSGPGIPPNDLPHLFEPFWQAKKTAHLGAGLGLKITRGVVIAHGGTIEVSNGPEGGAVFALEIPAATN